MRISPPQRIKTPPPAYQPTPLPPTRIIPHQSSPHHGPSCQTRNRSPTPHTIQTSLARPQIPTLPDLKFPTSPALSAPPPPSITVVSPKPTACTDCHIRGRYEIVHNWSLFTDKKTMRIQERRRCQRGRRRRRWCCLCTIGWWVK